MLDWAEARPGALTPKELAAVDGPVAKAVDPPRVVVVGPCASGKTTLVRGLRRLGYEATVSGQEHSEIPTLWRHAEPDVVVALDVDLPTVRRRRGEDWPEWLYLVQRRRLRQAVAAADVRVDTSGLDEEAVLRRVVAQLRRCVTEAGSRDSGVGSR